MTSSQQPTYHAWQSVRIVAPDRIGDGQTGVVIAALGWLGDDYYSVQYDTPIVREMSDRTPDILSGSVYTADQLQAVDA